MSIKLSLVITSPNWDHLSYEQKQANSNYTQKVPKRTKTEEHNDKHSWKNKYAKIEMGITRNQSFDSKLDH